MLLGQEAQLASDVYAFGTVLWCAAQQLMRLARSLVQAAPGCVIGGSHWAKGRAVSRASVPRDVRSAPATLPTAWHRELATWQLPFEKQNPFQVRGAANSVQRAGLRGTEPCAMHPCERAPAHHLQ